MRMRDADAGCGCRMRDTGCGKVLMRQRAEEVMRVRNIPAFALEGEIDMATSDEIVETLRACEPGTILVDLSGVTFLDSSGIRAFLRVADWLGDRGCLVLHGEPQAVRRVLDLVGIERVAPNIHRTDDGKVPGG
jgi:anti-anti-sigma factor